MDRVIGYGLSMPIILCPMHYPIDVGYNMREGKNDAARKRYFGLKMAKSRRKSEVLKVRVKSACETDVMMNNFL